MLFNVAPLLSSNVPDADCTIVPALLSPPWPSNTTLLPPLMLIWLPRAFVSDPDPTLIPPPVHWNRFPGNLNIAPTSAMFSVPPANEIVPAPVPVYVPPQIAELLLRLKTAADATEKVPPVLRPLELS